VAKINAIKSTRLNIRQGVEQTKLQIMTNISTEKFSTQVKGQKSGGQTPALGNSRGVNFHDFA
jgi:hypothetical protein